MAGQVLMLLENMVINQMVNLVNAANEREKLIVCA